MTPEFKERMIASLPLEGWCTEAKAEVLCDTLFLHAPSVCVEIGVFGGRSLVPQALALKELGGARHILGIDPWKLDAALEGDIGKDNEKWWTENVNLESIYRGFVESVLKNDLTDHCRWFRGRSEQAVRLFDDKSVDWLHQDSNHSEIVSVRDVDLWAPKMAKKSVWIMDDVDWFHPDTKKPTQTKALKMIQDLGYYLAYHGGTYAILVRS